MLDLGVDKNDRIAVIGAGISGLTAAQELRARGYSRVEVFEKESDVGGKILTVYHKGRPYELGALIFSRQFNTIFALSNKYQQQHFAIGTPLIVGHSGERWTYGHFIRKTLGFWPFALAALRMMRGDLWREWKCHEAGFDSTKQQLYLSMSDFNKTEHMVPASECVRSIMTGCGYGCYEQVPALYLMKLAPMVLKGLVKDGLTFGLNPGWQIFKNGWQQLCREMAADLLIHQSSPVKAIRRYGGSSIELETSQTMRQFDRLIITTPVDEALKFIDATPLEQSLFERVSDLRYKVTLLEADGLFMAGFIDHTTCESMGHVTFIVQPYADTNTFLVYQQLPEHMTNDEANKLLMNDIASVGGHEVKVIKEKEWRYFPHVGSEDLSSGYTEKLEHLQGANRTYYAGALFGFETTEHNALYAKDLVNKYF